MNNYELKRIITNCDEAAKKAAEGLKECNDIKYYYWTSAIVRNIGLLGALLCVIDENDTDPQLLQRAKEIMAIIQ